MSVMSGALSSGRLKYLPAPLDSGPAGRARHISVAGKVDCGPLYEVFNLAPEPNNDIFRGLLSPCRGVSGWPKKSIPLKLYHGANPRNLPSTR
jgi:hypothetical protein